VLILPFQRETTERDQRESCLFGLVGASVGNLYIILLFLFVCLFVFLFFVCLFVCFCFVPIIHVTIFVNKRASSANRWNH
jgi:hypothetical protein